MENYKKYLKYKTKYLTLRKQIGGNPEINIMIACSSLKKKSTFYDKFFLILKIINDKYIYHIPKNIYFCMKFSSQAFGEGSDLFFKTNNLEDNKIELLKNLSINIIKPTEDTYVYNNTIMDMINLSPELLPKNNINYDMIIFAECNDIVSYFTGDFDFLQRYLTALRNKEIEDLYKIIIDNIIKFYNKLNDKSIILNMYYCDEIFCDFNITYAQVTFLYLPLFITVVILLNFMFEKEDNGIYILKNRKSDEEIKDFFNHNLSQYTQKLLKMSEINTVDDILTHFKGDDVVLGIFTKDDEIMDLFLENPLIINYINKFIKIFK
jgi:hypothetical protein